MPAPSLLPGATIAATGCPNTRTGPPAVNRRVTCGARRDAWPHGARGPRRHRRPGRPPGRDRPGGQLRPDRTQHPGLPARPGRRAQPAVRHRPGPGLRGAAVRAALGRRPGRGAGRAAADRRAAGRGPRPGPRLPGRPDPGQAPGPVRPHRPLPARRLAPPAGEPALPPGLRPHRRTAAGPGPVRRLLPGRRQPDHVRLRARRGALAELHPGAHRGLRGDRRRARRLSAPPPPGPGHHPRPAAALPAAAVPRLAGARPLVRPAVVVGALGRARGGVPGPRDRLLGRVPLRLHRGSPPPRRPGRRPIRWRHPTKEPEL